MNMLVTTKPPEGVLNIEQGIRNWWREGNVQWAIFNAQCSIFKW